MSSTCKNTNILYYSGYTGITNVCKTLCLQPLEMKVLIYFFYLSP